MKKWIKKFESIFVSVTFAEMGEHNDARNMLGIKIVNPKKLWDEVFISVTFAEAG
jgi:PhoPQ-activated pathogenicity-related protein